MPRLILASASPRRLSLLVEAGFHPQVHPADIDETFPEGMSPSDAALHIAAAKSAHVSRQFPHDVVLAADTVVALGDVMLGKPTGAHDARGMLELLGGSTHIVTTGVSVVCFDTHFNRIANVSSSVQMRKLTPEEIDAYIASGQWQGKAGGYGIQDDDPFVTCMSGSTTNIVGLPMEKTIQLLAEAGIRPV